LSASVDKKGETSFPILSLFKIALEGCRLQYVIWVPLVVRFRPPWLMMLSTGGIGVPPATPSFDLNQLRIRQMHKAAVISYRWKIRLFAGLLRVLFLLDRVAGDADIVVMLERQLDGFLQRHMARRWRVTVGHGNRGAQALLTSIAPLWGAK
jgi:hypothetical protein